MIFSLIGGLLILASLASIYYGWKFENEMKELDIDDDWILGQGGLAIAFGGIFGIVGILLLLRVI